MICDAAFGLVIIAALVLSALVLLASFARGGKTPTSPGEDDDDDGYCPSCDLLGRQCAKHRSRPQPLANLTDEGWVVEEPGTYPCRCNIDNMSGSSRGYLHDGVRCCMTCSGALRLSPATAVQATSPGDFT